MDGLLDSSASKITSSGARMYTRGALNVQSKGKPEPMLQIRKPPEVPTNA
jgi:hypothetical protein